jgi:hypothetical protein
MAYAPSSTYKDADDTIIGFFRERDTDNAFEFSVNDDDTEFGEQFPHKIWVDDRIANPYRYAHVLKTVAYVAVDENADGTPVIEKWSIKNWRQYS